MRARAQTRKASDSKSVPCAENGGRAGVSCGRAGVRARAREKERAKYASVREGGKRQSAKCASVRRREQTSEQKEREREKAAVSG